MDYKGRVYEGMEVLLRWLMKWKSCTTAARTLGSFFPAHVSPLANSASPAVLDAGSGRAMVSGSGLDRLSSVPGMLSLHLDLRGGI